MDCGRFGLCSLSTGGMLIFVSVSFCVLLSFQFYFSHISYILVYIILISFFFRPTQSRGVAPNAKAIRPSTTMTFWKKIKPFRSQLIIVVVIVVVTVSIHDNVIIIFNNIFPFDRNELGMMKSEIYLDSNRVLQAIVVVCEVDFFYT